MVPQPQRVETAADRLTYVFAVAGEGPAAVSLRLEPQQSGLRVAQVGRGGERAVVFSQFIFP
jgi:hypothetical protein